MYDVVASFVLTVERDELPATHDELLKSVTHDEVADGPMEIHGAEWKSIKSSWLCSTPDNTTVYDPKTGIDYYR